MKDMARRIFEKENQAEVSNNIDKRTSNKSFTQLVTLTLMNNERQLRQPKLEYKSIDLKSTNNYSSLTQRPLQLQKQSFHGRPELKQKTTTNTSSLRAYSPLQNRQHTSTSISSNVPPKDNKQQELQKLLLNYSDDILSYFETLNIESPRESLKNHQISTTLRAKMIDWMVEVLTSYKCKDQTFFLAVRLMDDYLMKSPNHHSPQDLHLVGVACMFISSKFEEIYPVKLSIVHEKIAHKKLSRDEIKDKETEITLVTDFKLVGVTIQEIIAVTLAILQKYNQIYSTSVYLAKMSLYDYDVIGQNDYMIIAAACIIVGAKIVEQVDNSVSSETFIPIVVNKLNLQQELVMEVANKVLKLAKNFDKQFPNLENLKKFNKFSFQEALKTQK